MSTYPGNNPDAEPTERQLGFLNKLLDDRGVQEQGFDLQAYLEQIEATTIEDLNRREVSELIDYLKGFTSWANN